jgi:hypothetical protein
MSLLHTTTVVNGFMLVCLFALISHSLYATRIFFDVIAFHCLTDANYSLVNYYQLSITII